MAQHLQISLDPDTLAMRVAQTALRTAQSAQTRKAANIYIPDGDGSGVLIGDTADKGISRYDPETETQSPLWEGISQEELNAKGEEILGAAAADTAAQITVVNQTINQAQQQIESNREGIEAEAYLRAEGDKAAQSAAAAVKEETDKLKGDYADMSTDVASVKADLVAAASRIDDVEASQEQTVKDIAKTKEDAANASSAASRAESTAQAAKDLAGDNAAKTIVGSVIEYAVGGSTSAPTSGWTSGTVTRPAGATVWMRTKLTYGDGRVEYSAAAPVTGDQGAAGAQGPQGPQGETGATGATGATGPQGPQGEAGAKGDKGDTGAQGPAGPAGPAGAPGAAGADGADGVSITAVTTYYRLAAAMPAQPTAQNPGSWWSTSEPELDRASNLYTCTRIDYSNNTWSWTPVSKSGAYEMSQAAQNAADDAKEVAQKADTLSKTTEKKQEALGEQFALTKATADEAAEAAASAQRLANVLASQTAELLYNGGFEAGEDGWASIPDGKAFIQQSQWSHSGSRRAYLNGALGSRGIVSTRPIAATVGQQYRFSAWYKLTTALAGGDEGGLRLQYTGDAIVTEATTWADFVDGADFVYTGDAWTHAEQTVTIPDGVKWIRAVIVFPVPVDAYIDDCSVQDVTLLLDAEKQAQEATALARKLDADLQNADARLTKAEAAAADAQTTADSKNKRFVQPDRPMYDMLKPADEWWQTSPPNLETRWLGEPNNSASVLIDHSNEIRHIWTWNGTTWVPLLLAAEDLLVSGTVAASLVTADFFDGAVIKGGAYLTSNERIQLNNSGFFVEDSQGLPVVTIDAANGQAVFNSVLINGAGLSTPAISGGTIDGADYKLTAGTGANKTTVAQINSDGILFGDHLSYAKNAQGQWVLSIKGAIQSGGEISGPVITAPTIQTSSAEKTGLKFTSGGLVAYNPGGDVTFTLDAATGQIMMAGAVLSNATLTAPVLQTDPAENRGIKIAGQQLAAYAADGTAMLALDGETGVALLTGGMRTASEGRRLEINNVVYDSVSVAAIRGYDLVGESWHMVGTSNRTHDGEIDNWYTQTLELGINPQQPELSIMYANRYHATTISMVADRVNIVGYGSGNSPIGRGVYVNGRRIDWDQDWTDLTLQSGASAVGAAQYGQRAGLLCFRGRVKTTGSGDNQLVDLALCVSGFQTSEVNRTWIVGSMKNSVASTARVFIPAGSTILTVAGGPWDWVDLGSIVIAL